METSRRRFTIRKEFEYLIKILLMGDKSVGAKQLKLKFVVDHEDQLKKQHCDCAFDPLTQDVELHGIKTRLQIWDTSSMTNHIRDKLKALKMNAMSNSFYKNFDGVFLVYDITNYKSFEKLYGMMREVLDEIPFGDPMPVLMVLGNNCERESKRKVPFKQEQAYGKCFDVKVFEVSHRKGTNVDNAFFEMTRDILKEKNPSLLPHTMVNHNPSKREVSSTHSRPPSSHRCIIN